MTPEQAQAKQKEILEAGQQDSYTIEEIKVFFEITRVKLSGQVIHDQYTNLMWQNFTNAYIGTLITKEEVEPHLWDYLGTDAKHQPPGSQPIGVPKAVDEFLKAKVDEANNKPEVEAEIVQRPEPTPEPKPKRKRRTKAEMAEARAKETK